MFAIAHVEVVVETGIASSERVVAGYEHLGSAVVLGKDGWCSHYSPCPG